MIVRSFALLKCSLKYWRLILGILIPIILLPIPLLNNSQEAKCGYIIIWIALYFMFEPIPLPATALLPVIMFPLCGILTTAESTIPYMKDTIMMYVGGLIMATAVEHCNLHKRIALRVLLWIGTGTRWLMLGFMITTMFLSMWISNTATTAMMVPIVEAVLLELQVKNKSLLDFRRRSGELSIISLPSSRRGSSITNKMSEMDIYNDDNGLPANYYDTLKTALFLSVAYAANAGGTGTLIGSGPNLVLQGYLTEKFPNSKELTFATWMVYNIPGMLICVILIWLSLQAFYLPCRAATDRVKAEEEAARKVILNSYQQLGSMTFHEWAVTFLFFLLVILWFMRDPQFIPGWSNLFQGNTMIGDATASIGVCLFLFLIPSSLKTPDKPLLDWRTVQQKVPWGVLIILGSGFTIAEGAKKSGLSSWVGTQLASLSHLSPGVIVVVLTIGTSALTEVISNMSMATVILPVVAELSQAIRTNPIYLMLPVTISCSFAFMLPVGNPSNAIVFTASSMKTFDMIKPGFMIKLICCGVELMMIETLGFAVFSLDTFPDWAKPMNVSLVSQ